jgi:hypothetical protein
MFAGEKVVAVISLKTNCKTMAVFWVAAPCNLVELY